VTRNAHAEVTAQVAGKVTENLADSRPGRGDRRQRHPSMPLAHPDGAPARRWRFSALAPRRPGSIVCRESRPQAAAAAGNEVGTTGAHSGALQLFPAHLCAGFTCEDREKA